MPFALVNLLSDWLPKDIINKAHLWKTKKVDNVQYQECMFQGPQGLQWLIHYHNEDHFYIQREVRHPETKEKIWMTLQNNPLSASDSKEWPKSVQNCSRWWSPEGNYVYFFGPKGNIHYTADYNEKTNQSQNFHQHFLPPASPVFFPETTMHHFFTGIDPSSELIFLKRNDTYIAYNTQTGFSYEWDQNKNTWSISLLPHHTIFPQIEARQLATTRQLHRGYLSRNVRLLPETFEDFLAAKDEITGQIKIIMQRKSYDPKLNKMDKHSRRYPSVTSDETALSIYTIDPEKGLLAENAEGNFYLAYIFYLHGKHSEALKQLHHGIKRLEKWTPEIKQLVSWIEQWPAKNPNANALKLHLKLMAQEWHELHVSTTEDCEACESEIDAILAAYPIYKGQISLLDGHLRLHSRYEEKIRFLTFQSHRNLRETLPFSDPKMPIDTVKPKATIELKEGSESKENEEILDVQSITTKKALAINFIEDAYRELPEFPTLLAGSFYTHIKFKFRDLQAPQKIFEWYATSPNVRSFYQLGDLLYLYQHGLLIRSGSGFCVKKDEFSESEKKVLVNYALQIELQHRLDALEKAPKSDLVLRELPPNQEFALFSIDTTPFFEQKISSTLNLEAVRKNIKELESLKSQDEFLNELIDNMIADTKAYCASLGYDINENTAPQPQLSLKDPLDVEALTNHFEIYANDLRKSIKRSKETIMELLDLDLKGDPLVRQIAEQYATADDLFQEAKWCYARNNWEPLLNRGIITEDKIAALVPAICKYLEQRTCHQQALKVLHQIAACKNAPKDSHKKDLLAALLKQKRVYNPSKHPYGAICLVLEEEQESFSGPGIILTQRQLDHFIEMIDNRGSFKHEVWGGGKTSVLRNLISRYHADGQQLAGMLTLAPLIDQHDKLYREINTKAYGQEVLRVDYSRKMPTDETSLLRRFLALVHIVEHRGRIDQTLASLINLGHAFKEKIVEGGSNYQEMQLLQKMQNFYRERAVFGSDELDQLCTPEKQYNYSSGKVSNLEISTYVPGLKIMGLLLSNAYSEFLAYFQTKKTSDLSSQQKNALVMKLALDIANTYSDINLNMLVAYFLNDMSISLENRTQFYQNVVLKHASCDELINYKIYLSQIIPTTLKKVYGVRYIRSADGIHTKPANEKGEPAETSLFSSNQMMVFYALLDYIRNGVDAKGIPSYLVKLKEELIRKPNDAVALKDKFNRTFRCNLLEADENDYASIAKVMSSRSDLLADFLTKIYFSDHKYYSKRIQGSASLGVKKLKELWGSSGNAEGLHALPQAITKNPKLIHQEGTAGAVFVYLIHDLEKHGEPLFYDYSKPLAAVAGEFLKPGSGVNDIGALLAGRYSENVAEELRKATNTPVRYPGKNGNLLLKESDKSARVDLEEVSPDDVITLFMLKDSRGTDLVLPKDSQHVATLSSDTTYTRFSQGAFRFRAWGKGQTIRYIIDPGMKEKLEQSPLKDVSTATKLMWIFLYNEVQAQRPNIFLTDEAELISITTRTIEKAFGKCKNEKEAASLRAAILNVAPETIESPNGPSLEDAGKPTDPQAPFETLFKVIEEQKKSLQTIYKHGLGDEEDRFVASDEEVDMAQNPNIPEEVFQELYLGMNELELQRHHIESRKQYLGSILLDHDHDEELAVEVEQEVEMEQEQEIEETQEVQLEFQQEQEFEFEEDIREPYVYTLHSYKHKRTKATNCENLTLLTSENHAAFADWKKGCNGKQLFAPAVLFRCTENNITGTLGPIKYIDLFGTPDEFSDSRKPIGKEVVPEKELFCFKWNEPMDIYSYGKHIGLSEEQRAKAEEIVAFAKFQYAAVEILTVKEIKILSNWLKTQDNLPALYVKLESYLFSHYNKDKHWPLLALMNTLLH